MNNKLIFKLSIIGLSLVSANSYAARTTCFSPILSASEIVTAIDTNTAQCNNTSTKILWTVKTVSEVSGTNKVACKGNWGIPDGYTVLSQQWSSSCSNTANVITANSNPDNQAFSFYTEVNTVLTGTLSTTDPDEDTIEYELSSIESGNLSIDKHTGEFTFQPPTDQADNLLAIVHAKDAKGGVGQILMFIDVGSSGEEEPTENQPPIVWSGHYSTHLGMTIDQRGGYIDQYGFFMSAEDPDGDAITYLNIYTSEWPKNGFITNGGSGNHHKIYTPNEGYWGEEVIVIKAKDSNNNVGWGTHTILIKPLDNDSDGMPNTWELQEGLLPDDPSDAQIDADNDGLTNLAEYTANTDPQLNDSDGDQIFDGYEVRYGSVLDPNNPNDAHLDSDNDGYTNLEEFEAATDPSDASSRPDAPIAAWLIPVLSIILN
jgi:hypothetical protein